MNDIVFAGKHFLTYTVNRHKHRDWELVYCTGSSGCFVFDQVKIPYTEGDTVVIPPDTPHENLSDGGFTNIHLNVADAAIPVREPFLIRDDSNQTLLHLFADAYWLFRGEPEKKAALLSAYGDLIIRYINAGRAAMPRNSATDEIRRSIVQNYADTFYEVDDVIRALPYSYDYLCKLFRKETGVTPHRYLTHMRLQSAADMLCTTPDSSITEVAHLCGFRDPLYFSRLFKKKYSVSPNAYYRLRLKEEEAPAGDSDSQKVSL
ncbi:MAG: helix-turn-helix domain-containing protein [Clostridia bacterium]|nr:helix-turn-helix domain-containing protein [Clostridia bacterium]